jgi:monoamine oxidase
MSIADWIDAHVPGGMSSKLGQLLDVAYNIEYGAESSVQSSLDLLYLLGYAGPGQMRIFGKSNEKYHTIGGNDQIPERLADNLAGQINMGYELTAVARNTDGTWTLSFGNNKPVKADRVILAIPFSILRNVDLKKAQFEPRKMRAINELGMGTNTKMHVGFKTRFWRDLGCNGETYADTGYQNTWEVSRGQPGPTGLLVDYTGGNIGASFTKTAADYAPTFLDQIEPLLPGANANWNGKATLDYWTGYKWTKGSYSYWKVGQYTAFAGWSEPSRTAATSPVSTRRSTSRGTCRAAWRPGSAPRTRSSRRTSTSSAYLLTSSAAPIAPPRSPSVATLIAGGFSSTKRWGIIASVMRFA